MNLQQLLDKYGKDLPWGLQGMLKAILTNKLPKKDNPSDASILEYPIMVNGKAMTDIQIVVMKVNNGASGFICIATDADSIAALQHSANMLEQDGVASSESVSSVADTKA